MRVGAVLAVEGLALLAFYHLGGDAVAYLAFEGLKQHIRKRFLLLLHITEFDYPVLPKFLLLEPQNLAPVTSLHIPPMPPTINNLILKFQFHHLHFLAKVVPHLQPLTMLAPLNLHLRRLTPHTLLKRLALTKQVAPQLNGRHVDVLRAAPVNLAALLALLAIPAPILDLLYDFEDFLVELLLMSVARVPLFTLGIALL